MLDIIRTNESSEFLSYFPQWRGLYNRVKEHLTLLSAEMQKSYDSLPHQNPDDSIFEAALTEALGKHGHREILTNVFRQLRTVELAALQQQAESSSHAGVSNGGPIDRLPRNTLEYLKTGELREVFKLTEYLRGDGKNLPSGSNEKTHSSIQNHATKPTHYKMGKQHKGGGAGASAKRSADQPTFSTTFADDAKPFQKTKRGGKK